jgi:hypothetical protein
MKKNNNITITKYAIALALVAGAMNQPALAMSSAMDTSANTQHVAAAATASTLSSSAAAPATQEHGRIRIIENNSKQSAPVQVVTIHATPRIRIIDTTNESKAAQTPIQIVTIHKMVDPIAHAYHYMTTVLGLNAANDMYERAVWIGKCCEQIKKAQVSEKIPFNDARSTFNKLLHYAATINNEPRYGVVDDNMVIILALQRAGVPIDCKDANGRTALHTATLHGSKQTIKYLINLGASLSAIDNNGLTPQQMLMIHH